MTASHGDSSPILTWFGLDGGRLCRTSAYWRGSRTINQSSHADRCRGERRKSNQMRLAWECYDRKLLANLRNTLFPEQKPALAQLA
jgi:hypothetical protein